VTKPSPNAELKHRFADAVRKRRNELGVTQEELAWRAGMHRTYLARIEACARNPSLASIAKLSRALEISLSVLFASAEGKASRPASGAACPQAGGLPGQVVEILLVEDNPDDVELTRQAFRQARIANRVHVVGDGAAALDYLCPSRRRAPSPPPVRPHLILLDLGLPKVDGLEVLRRIRADRRTRRIPVIVMTVSRDEADFAECRRLGVSQYLLKPVSFQNLSSVTPPLNLSWALLKENGAKET
jgi:CheY-like chemotaxis protein/DNA-binding XRE family transcriptional regulator